MSLADVLQSIVLWLGILLEWAAVFLVVRRKLYRQLPAFSAYCFVSAPRSIILILTNKFASYAVAYYSYWVSEALIAILGLLVIFELFDSVMQSYEGIRTLGRIVFRWIAVALTVLAISFVIYSYRNSRWTYIAGILALEQGIQTVRVGLILFLFFFASALALSWKHRTFGIALGFGVTGLGNLAAYTMLSTMGRAAFVSYELIGPASYVCAATIWVYYLAIPQPEPFTRPATPRFDLAGWDRAIVQVLKR